jgi:hypothetical protein
VDPSKVELRGDVYTKGKLRSFPANNRLGWKFLAVTNATACNNLVTITSVKVFTEQVCWANSRLIRGTFFKQKKERK